MKKNKILVILLIIIVLVLSIVLFNKIRKNNNNENQTSTQLQEATQDIAQVMKQNKIQEESSQKIIEQPKEYVKVLSDGTRENNSSKVISEKVVGNLKINNIKVTSDRKDTFIKADVKTNDGSKMKEGINLKIDLLKEDGTVWISIIGIVAKTEDDTEGRISTRISDYDFTNVYDVKITIK